MSLDVNQPNRHLNSLSNTELREQVERYLYNNHPADQRLTHTLLHALQATTLVSRRATTDFGELEMPEELRDLVAQTYEGVTFNGTMLFGSASQAVGASTEITSGITVTSVLPGERSARHGTDGVGKPIYITITNDESTPALTVTDETDYILIAIVHGDSTLTLTELVDLINEDDTAKYIVTAALTVSGTGSDEVDDDDAFYVASAYTTRGTSSARVPADEYPDAGYMLELRIAGHLCDGLDETGFGITSAAADELVVDFDLDGYTDPFVRFELRAGGHLIFDQYVPIHTATVNNRLMPYRLYASLANESANARDLTLTVKDADGNVVEAARRLQIEVRNSDLTVADPTTDWKLTTVTGDSTVGANKNVLQVTTNASGVAVVRITDMSSGTRSCIVLAQGVNITDGEHPIGNRQVTASFT
jgi:hypothetical protein